MTAAPPAGGVLDPGVWTRRSRRRWLAGLVIISVALLSAVVALLVVRSQTQRAQATTNRTTAHHHTGTTVRGSPAFAVGALVAASLLYSDPVFVNSTNGFALARGTGGAASERLATSADAGATWHVAGAPFPVAGDFTTLLFTDADHGYVFGPAGLIVTTDGGAHWTEAPLTGQVVRVLPAYGTVWAVGLACQSAPGLASNCPVTVAISHDQGEKWSYTRAAPPVGEAPSGGAGLGLVDATNSYVVTWGADTSGLAVTFDSGEHWTKLDDPCSVTGWSIVDMVPLLDGDMWLICGGPPTLEGETKSVYRTSDGGHHWTLVSSTGLTPAGALPTGSIPYSGLVSQLATVDPLIAWLGVGGVGVLQTRDGGRHWFEVSGIAGAERAAYMGVTFIRSPNGQIDDGWALGFGIGLWRTTDAVHWRPAATG
jgi:photosystem II stability/assembly factor-like uncharacterized protein